MAALHQKIGILLFVLVVGSGWESRAENHNPAQISESEAETLVHEVIESQGSKGTLEASPNNAARQGMDSDFYGFVELAPNPGGGARIASFAVNRSTGDVWNMQGSVCTRLTGSTLIRHQQAIQEKSGLDHQAYELIQAKKPVECD